MRDRNRYFLKAASGSAYQLDDQQKARQFDGKEVKLVGTPDENRHSINVVSIELIAAMSPT
jgi:hypothetical protein